MFFAKINLLIRKSPRRRWATYASCEESGQTLVELMVAMSVVTIGLLGVFAVLSQSLGLNRIVANQYTATGLAAEGIEITKNIADSNILAGRPWNEGLNADGSFGVSYNGSALERGLAQQELKFDSASGIYSYQSGVDTSFKRIITLNNINANEIKVSSKVEWTDRGGRSFSVNLEDRLFNWR